MSTDAAEKPKSGKKSGYSKSDIERLEKACELLGYKFKDYTPLRHALTHSSAKSAKHPSNERMEFLGDAVLGLIISEMLFRLYPDFPEGELTRVKSVAVSRAVLADRIREMGFAELMYLGKGVRRDGGTRLPTSILANLYEALLCAVYEEGGLEEARRFVERDLGPVIRSITNHQFQQNYKSALQHLVQSRSERAPTYKVIGEVGPDHQKEFHVNVSVDGVTFGPGVGRNKKEAEQRAAKAALTELLKEFDREDDDDDLLEVPVPEDDFDDE
ncbi:MAG: ribonuclease III [Planctomycetes bacterium]|nr:ribonuclease III [Planctomycetota bacterium]MCA8935131.1 ribonuclease III [Planctomycetota bacterium]MCA8946816.1 ribonuclease III [Planctomycetota bacterium]